MKTIVAFEWDHGKNENYNGKSLIVGQHLPRRENEEITHIESYGISISALKTSIDFQLKRQTCYVGNLVSDVKPVTRDEARALLIAEIDNQLEVLFNETEQEVVNDKLNVPHNFSDDNEDND